MTTTISNLNLPIKKVYTAPDSLCEIAQSKSLRFAFAIVTDTEIQRVMPYVKCRDFLKEQILYTHYDKKLQIYSFDTSKNVKNALDYTGLLVEIPKKEERDLFIANFHILQKYEEKLGFELTSEVQQVDEKTLFVSGDPIWQQSCFLISLYSLLLRTLCYPLTDTFVSMLDTSTGANSVDGRYWKALDNFDKIKSRDQLLDLVAKEDVKDMSVDTVHDFTGAYYMLMSKQMAEKQGCTCMIPSVLGKMPVWSENWSK